MTPSDTISKTALITGASRGLGLALARELVQQGWSLIINARGRDALNKAASELKRLVVPGAMVTAIAGDVTDPSHRQALAAAAQAAGGLDAVVNNASILGPSPQPHLLDYDLDTLENVYRANVFAPLAMLQAVRPSLKDDARILNISSDAGVEAYPGWGGYGSSKAALEQLSAILAAENPQWRVYWVDPGDMQTQMHQEAFPGEDISDRPLPEASVPGLIALLTGDYASARYKARSVGQTETTGIGELRVSLTVKDFDQAVAFYRNGLGMGEVTGWAGENGRGIVLDGGRATLELLDETHAAFVDQIEVGARASEKVRLALEVSDLTTAAEAAQTHGATALNAPVPTPWGDQNQRLQAPDGMQITLFQAGSQTTSDPLPETQEAAS
ncbi:MAG: SDR family NAD(P)-dependent oxidoreductase [bacterium]|nr:SDR family NAD(P)-dependent oxidoreductase [bacterium]